MDLFTRKLFVKHRTEFTYAGAASESVNEIRLGPVDGPRQRVEYSRITLTPSADVAESTDVWGNRVWWCQIVADHPRLVVEAESLISLREPTSVSAGEDGADGWRAIEREEYREAWAEFLLPSDLVAWSDATRRFADGLVASPAGGVASWTRQLAAALNAALVYERGATDVTTTVDGVIVAGRGGACVRTSPMSLSPCAVCMAWRRGT